MATQAWAEVVWIGKWPAEQKEAWMKQIFEVLTWRKVRGLVGAVMCKTRDLGVQWHTSLFDGNGKVDMRFVCPKDVSKMLLKQARTTRKKWTAKH